VRVLGVSYGYHDASAALWAEGHLVAACAEERYSLLKHDSSFPRFATRSCLQLSNTEPTDLDAVVFYEQPSVKFTRVLASAYQRYPGGIGQFGRSMRTWLGEKLWVRNAIVSQLGVSPRKVLFAPHHESHIAQAFGPSGFESAAVLVVDGVGEWACTTLAKATRDAAGVRYQIIEQAEYPRSIGLVYAAFTAFLGFKSNSGESSTMALAAYGRPIFVDRIRQVFHSQRDGSYDVIDDFFDFDQPEQALFTQRFVTLFGTPRDFRRPLPFSALDSSQRNVSEEERYYADVAASLQQVLLEILLGLAKRVVALSGETNLCFSGGVALNCVCNAALMNAGVFDQFFIPPDPGDGGAAFGAAYWRAAQTSSGAIGRPINPYLGAGVETRRLKQILDGDALDECLSHPAGLRAQSVRCRWLEQRDEDACIDHVVEALLQGKIVAWVQGRFELGPRALGNRSLLVHPAHVESVRRLSTTVKSHSAFRPYALSMTAEAAGKILETPCITAPALKWMQTVWPVQEAFGEALRGGIHVDGTTRPQVCTREENPRFWKLLSRIGEATGHAVVLNTSLNERSMPIVSTSELALAMFTRTGIDLLAIDNVLVTKIP
jgi:carbamoyltransferase